MMEYVPSRWPLYTNISAEATLLELAATFEGWHCLVMCNAARFFWDRLTLGSPEDCPAAGDEFPRGVPPVDVYCLAPGIAPQEDAGVRAILHCNATIPRHRHRAGRTSSLPRSSKGVQ